MIWSEEIIGNHGYCDINYFTNFYLFKLLALELNKL